MVQHAGSADRVNLHHCEQSRLCRLPEYLKLHSSRPIQANPGFWPLLGDPGLFQRDHCEFAAISSSKETPGYRTLLTSLTAARAAHPLDITCRYLDTSLATYYYHSGKGADSFPTDNSTKCIQIWTHARLPSTSVIPSTTPHSCSTSIGTQ